MIPPRRQDDREMEERYGDDGACCGNRRRRSRGDDAGGGAGVGEGARDTFDLGPWADRVQLVDAEHEGPWELPVLGAVPAPTAVLIRPDGHVAWVGGPADPGLPEALACWFGQPTA